MQTLIQLVAGHPHWAAALVFFCAMAEAIAVIGMFVPGTAILIGVGAVVGLGELSLWPILLWATLGAIAGDGISYWIGHRYKDRIRSTWPLRERPELFARGEAFFARFGTLSVAIGRFVPGVRAVIPLVAGVVGMPPARFFLVNVLSALVWAPAHILPGAGMGLALGVLGSIAGRLVAMLVGALILIGFAIWLGYIAWRWMLPGLGRRYRRLIRLAKRRDTAFDRVLVAVLDPDDPGTSTLIVMGAAVIALAVAFVSLAEDVLMREQITRMDTAVSTLVQGWRTPGLDRVMIAITSLGDGVVITAVLLAIVVWLLLRRQVSLAVGLILTMGLAALSVPLMKGVFVIPRPIDIYTGADAFSFPSGHATSAAALYASAAWLATHNAPFRWKVAGFALAGVLITAIAASRIYLAAHWPSDVLAGLALGSALSAIYALVFRRLDLQAMRPFRFVGVVLAALLVAGGLRVATNYSRAVDAYRPRVVETSLDAAHWRLGDWATFPADRWELDGSEGGALTLQSDAGVEALREALVDAGWQIAPSGGVGGFAKFLSPDAPLDGLPPLPQTHAGSFAVLTMVRPVDADHRLVLRFWPTTVSAESADRRDRILLGSLSDERVSRPLGLATLLRDPELSAAEQFGLLGSFPQSGRLDWVADEAGGRRVLLLLRREPASP
ncbi:bifunctional DedA family/phosphatase PAP2 family protein [Kaistia sp. 32K]|uniref:bifunctional DedA family/phosphatase PAP2 family protein n=1 Tax=Kaistia sp. 32K TaxID=2795690 RepID=UPI001915CB6C|nr:bifunctional DedA family/phosphatase PAP2 family protein [Kaistia sp. 32K]